MTLHKSLKISSSLKRARNVLTRAERIKILEGDGRWDEAKSVFGLPKVRQYVMKRRHTKAAKKEEGVPGAEGAVAAEGAAAPAAAAGKGAGKAAAGGKAAAPAGKAPAAGKAAAPAKGGKGK
jgi:small basic protein (TIGR04137 family)